MENTHHEFRDLFEQLGLPSDEPSIRNFCSQHKLQEGQKLADASFWTKAQAQFLHDALTNDADWAVPIDQLNNSLHH
ncbi:MAG: hypothetical protein JWM78_939 [Verrucomicrobiaceae bacterium]|nr:hypothetical protein [Verrucomicrobiaceae bacterium]